MGRVQRFDRRLEGIVGNAFARMFGGKVVTQEVAQALERESEDNLRELAGGRLLAPNHYVVLLGHKDYDHMADGKSRITRILANAVAEHLAEHGWDTYGDVVVSLERTEALHTGQFRVRSTVDPDAAVHSVGSAGQQTPPRDAGDRAMSQPPGYGHYDQGDPYGQQNPYGYGQPGYDPGYGQPGYDPGYGQAGYDPGYGQAGYDQGDPYGQQNPYGYGPPGYDPGYGAPGGAPGYGPPGGAPGYDPGYGPPGGAPGYGPPGGAPGYDPGYGPPGGAPGYDPGYDPGYGPPGGAPGYDPGYGPPGGAPGYDPGYGGPAGPPPGAPGGAPGMGGYGQPGFPPPGGQGAPRQLSASLQLDDGSNRNYSLKQGGNVIGRGQDADFRLPDTGVSRRHLEITWDGQSATLADIGSTNGTTVNGTPVQTWQLADGDVIRVGHSSLTFRTQG
ncbi:FHA domain-containing protein [Haloechinothrix alba]|uniref:FHA domain-containing protein n=1 Tax=Haloechinothrix alba TaxID=664784 RepID=A0A238V200_9PSEU|nr:FhaA domain-containing protein [Haloechinothrix alba]SNR28171.1 FHA domain-containing protein [Haloechinothrix alba]